MGASHRSQLLACRSIVNRDRMRAKAVVICKCFDVRMPKTVPTSCHPYASTHCVTSDWQAAWRPLLPKSPTSVQSYDAFCRNIIHVSADHKFISQMLRPVKPQLQTSTSTEQSKLDTDAKNRQLLLSCTVSAHDLLRLFMAIKRLLLTHVTSNICMSSVINQLLSTSAIISSVTRIQSAICSSSLQTCNQRLMLCLRPG